MSDITQQSALDIARSFLDAWTSGNLAQAGTHLAADFIFDGPIAHYRSAADFLAGSEGFAAMLRPGWRKIAAFGDDREVLLLYDLEFRSRARMRIADHYLVSDGKITTETILWDTHGSPFRQATAAD